MAIMFRHPGSAKFFDYWDSLPKDGLVPDRSAFDPLSIARLMPQVIMVEYDHNNDAHFRLVGTGIVERLGFDPSQKSYLSYLDENVTEAFWIISQTVLATPCGGYFRVKAQSPTGYVFDLELLDLPMSNGRSGTQIILAHMAEIEVTGVAETCEFRILDIRSAGWIDLGAGCPAAALDEPATVIPKLDPQIIH